MLSRRIIPCLDVRDGQVVKGVRFRDHVVMGAIEDLALRYRDEGADELVFYDITASPQGRGVDVAWVESVARLLDIPFCVAGGIRSVDQARAVLHAGADKVSVNTPALDRPELVSELAAEFGVQCVVVGIDSLRDADGVRSGYDIQQLQAVRALCRVPLVASGGAGEAAHFAAAFEQADVDAALAASVFHAGTVRIRELKSTLRTRGIEVRDDA